MCAVNTTTDGSLLINARLPAEEGALVLAALEAGRDRHRAGGGQQGPSPTTLRECGGVAAEATHIGDSDGDEHEDAPGKREAVSNADALLLMAETFLSSAASATGSANGYEVVVHVDAGTLANEDDAGVCKLEHSPGLHPETAR